MSTTTIQSVSQRHCVPPMAHLHDQFSRPADHLSRGSGARLRFVASALGVTALIVAMRALSADAGVTPPDRLLLKEYRPNSILRVPATRVEKARNPAIDVHSRAYARTPEEVDRSVRTRDEVGIARTVVMTGATGKRFDELLPLYGRHPKRFNVWSGIDYTGFDQPGFGPAAVAELERCARSGARGVGELSDKGGGLRGNSRGRHLDDPRMDPFPPRARNSVCPSMSMLARTVGCTSRWTGTTTAS